MKKLLIGGIVAGVALLAPTAATATHIAGATYTGPVTTGSGGTATVVVSNDGQSLSFHAQNIGNGSSCTGVSFGPVTDIPISNHSFSYLSNDGLISASGTFGAPGDVSGGAQVLMTPCTTGSQAWSATATTPGPDAMIARAGQSAFAGDDVFNAELAEQTRSWSAKRGQARKFTVRVENDGNSAQSSFQVTGCRSSKAYKVRYTSGGQNITGEVTGPEGYGTDNLDVDQFENIVLSIKPTKKAKPGKTKTCTVNADYDPADLRDAVQAKVKVKRG
jgi:hypothetical protein